MKGLISLIIIAFVLPISSAQDTWKRSKQDPVATELHELVPPKVTPGEGTAPPSDAIVLFDGTSLDQWKKPNGDAAEWRVDGDGGMTVIARKGPILSKENFGDVQLHIEWSTPTELVGEGQGRGNSGVFFMGKYEVQVLDSYTSNTYSNGQAASIYKQYIPLANATKAPGEWQTYDIIFTRPIFGDNGRMVHPAYLTVIHNGVLVQNHVALLGPTEYIGVPLYTEHENSGPIMLQDHGNPVRYRNIWIRKL